MAEWLNAAVSKTVMGVFSSIEGSNPSPSVVSQKPAYGKPVSLTPLTPTDPPSKLPLKARNPLPSLNERRVRGRAHVGGAADHLGRLL